ncbi:cytochrome b [Bradyrhizobium liaoningense]|uniref:cytochrome b n=1 Tax=Bradyrhizobium liaoningense TaxID=43992 RepID=UPI001BA61584|nr:cytochrome b [Bradyrhizobium liaoningense]
MSSTSSRYRAGVQAFHWLTVVLVLVAYVLRKGDGYSLYSASADGLRRIHETLGALVFIVVVLRLLLRPIGNVPARRLVPQWMAAAARLVQFALYVLLIAIPATAVLGTWLEGIPVTLAGLDIAPLISPKPHGLGQLIMQIHASLGNAILWLGAVHAAAALFHHFCLRDEVFRWMIPGASMKYPSRSAEALSIRRARSGRIARLHSRRTPSKAERL